MNKYKVATIVGTRPELIRLSRTIELMDNHFDHVLVHTGQNYDFELSGVFFKELGLKTPKYVLKCGIDSSGPIQFISNALVEVDRVLEIERPDAVLVLGDTNSCLTILAAKKRKIPIFHLEAGNRCNNLNVPEEMNRILVDHMADINLTYSEIAREYLVNEGLPLERVIKIGSPMREVLNYYKPMILRSNVLGENNIKANEYIVVSLHREETVDNTQKLASICKTLNKIAEHFEIPILFSVHPRTRKAIDRDRLILNKNIMLMRPLGFFDYIFLQMNALFVLSDSGTISEESSILGFRALNLRDAHERPEAMKEASVMMVGLNDERIFQGINLLMHQNTSQTYGICEVKDYESSNFSHKVVRIIISHIDYVNNVVWRKA